MDHGKPEAGVHGVNRGQPDFQQQLIEVLVFLFLIVPSMALSFFVGQLGNLNFVAVAVSTMVRDLSLLALILYFLWRNHEPLSRLGWKSYHLGRDLALGLGFFIPVFYGANLLENFLRQAGLSAPSGAAPSFLSPHGPGELVLGAILVVVVAVAEETIFRGYLMLRFQALHLGPSGAALLSAIIFSLGHGYEGAAGVITVGALGLVFALIYLWRGSLVAPAVLHFLQDFIGIVIGPLVK